MTSIGTTTRSWGGNPMNRRDQIAQASLPALLFRQCHLNCVDSEMFQAETESEKLCIQNCQDKTYSAFNMYMEVKTRKAMEPEFTNVAEFVEFDTQAANDTTGTIPNSRDIIGVRQWQKLAVNQLFALRNSAYGFKNL